MGQRMVCGNHLRNMGMATVLYADDSDGWYVPIIYRPKGAGSRGTGRLAQQSALSETVGIQG